MAKYLLPFLVAVFISLATTPLVRKLSFKVGAVDIPKDNRRVHKEPMPTMGGLAIYLGVIITTLIFLPIDKTIFSIIAGGTLIVVSGIIDDVSELSAKKKLIFQIGAAIILIWGGVRIDTITNPFSPNNTLLNLGILSIPITIFWIVGIINTLNLIDGLDGLSAGVAMISSLSLMFVAGKFGLA
ncbi:MAG: undecaprenyl/decaprenyl-phosphate alpha-N-acetylglucosaminyl 1-phosphate transferase, partial [Tissierellia bacterium]|nr:undecaprenyl/decaprenyl-phosphate alpha-N-acetylglucosaminyl 1-phosphate transferase [Tissierellia bacterium]